MFIVSAIAGNLYSSSKKAEKWRRANSDGRTERLLVSRTDMEKSRMRRKTDKGTEVGFVFERGTRLHHGDILEIRRKIIAVEQLPEAVATVTIDSSFASHAADTAAQVGHLIGNRHRPISIKDGKISFPIQGESELETFRKLMPAGVKLDLATQVFIPTDEAHEHG